MNTGSDRRKGQTGRWLCILILLGLTPALQAQTGDDAQIDVGAAEERWVLPDSFEMSARVTEMTPGEPVDINWRHGGEGLGGVVVRGEFGQNIPVGKWTEWTKVSSLVEGKFPGKLYLIVTLQKPEQARGGGKETEEGFKDVVMEFEFRNDGKTLKTLKERGPEGPSFTLVVPAYRLAGGKTPTDPDFLEGLVGVLEYAQKRAEFLESLPWVNWPKPRKYAVINNLGGHGVGAGRGINTTDWAVVEAETRSLRQLGVNGFRGGADRLQEEVANKTELGKEFDRTAIIHIMNYPTAKKGTEEAGNPYHSSVSERTREGVARSLEEALSTPVDEVWALTDDEIGPVINAAPQGKRVIAEAPEIIAAFQEWLKSEGLTPGDFGKSEWSQVKTLDVFPPPKPRKAQPKADETPQKKKKKPPATAPAGWTMPNLNNPHIALAAYYTQRFMNHSSAQLFTSLKQTFAAANQAKQEALQSGDRDSPAAKQPWIYSYALRGNTFLMAGASLDFFEFYRLADNGFVYETSNMGKLIWQWDSYLCDVGRIVSDTMGHRFGIYIKPHRGAPIQRALSAVSRNVKMLYWYTYGPDYSKGDGFADNDDTLSKVSHVAHLIGKTEDVLYGSSWAKPAEVAIVRPQTSEIWMRLTDNDPAWTAAHENAKWTYSALAHAHIPVDPLDEVMLAEEDLSKYKVIYVNGPNITKASARKLAEWVNSGGTLYTSGGGLARDEANQPLEVLQPVLGLKQRNDPQMWYNVALYAATQVKHYDDPKSILAPVPDEAAIQGEGAYGSFKPQIGREVLVPNEGTEVLAKFADGSAAMTRHPHGKGQAYVVGFFPGLEYCATVLNNHFNMAKDFEASRRHFITVAATEQVQPVVDASHPIVEGILLVNKENGKRAVTLMNWAYRVTAQKKSANGAISVVVALVPQKDLKVSIRDAGEVSKVTSAMTDQSLKMQKEGDILTVTVPLLEEGDVLLLE